MFFEDGHPLVSLTDWEKWKQWVIPHPAETVVDRADIEFTPWFLPLARGAMIPSSRLLAQAGYVPGSGEPQGWLKQRDTYLRGLGRIEMDSLVVREWGRWWAVERWAERRRLQHSDEVLVHPFGSTPVLVPTREAAMRLARYCHENHEMGLIWVPACPINRDDAVALARQRRLEETGAP